MPDNNQTYTVQFLANAKGLDEIIQKITKITQGGEIKLTGAMQKDLAKLQNQAQLFIQTLEGELAKETPNADILRSLYNSFMQLTSQAQKFGLALSSLAVPKDLQSDLEAATAKLKDQQRQLKNLQQQYRTASAKVASDGGPSESAKTSALLKAQKGKEINTGSDQVNFDSAEAIQSYISKLTEANKSLQETDIAFQQNKTTIAELNEILEKYNKILQQVVQQAQQKMTTTQAEIQVQKANIAGTKEEINVLQQKVREQAGETSAASQTVDILTELSTVRSAQADALQNEKDKLAAEKRAQEEAAKAKREAEEQDKKLSKSIEDISKKTNDQTSAIKTNNTTWGRAAKQVLTYGTAISFLKRVYSETIRTITEMDEALTGMAVVTTMSRAQT